MAFFVTELKSAKRTQIEEKGAVLGRGPGVDIVVTDPKASEKHARISFNNDKWSIEDLGSEHGVIIHGARIKAPMDLRAGMRFIIGDTTFEVFHPVKPVPMAKPTSTAPTPMKDGESSDTKVVRVFGLNESPAAKEEPPTKEAETVITRRPTAPPPAEDTAQTKLAEPAPVPSPIEEDTAVGKRPEEPVADAELMDALDSDPISQMPPAEEPTSKPLQQDVPRPKPQPMLSEPTRLDDAQPPAPVMTGKMQTILGASSGLVIIMMLIYAFATAPTPKPAVVAAPEPASQPASVAVAPLPAPQAEPTPFERFQHKRHEIERIIEANALLLKQADILSMYDRLHQEPPQPKKKKNQRTKATEDRLRDIELFERSQALVDALYERLTK